MTQIIKLYRIKHYIKNILIFLPLFFSHRMFNTDYLCKAFIGFLLFCLISSTIYIINDINDIENDKNHPTKKNRPLASGKISINKAIILIIINCIIAIPISLLFFNVQSTIVLLVYFILNVLYSLKLKKIPIIDVLVLASGFVLRIIYGGLITNTLLSEWLYLVTMVSALFMGLGKRRNELRKQKKTRKVLEYYNEQFLDKNMYACFTMIIIFYSLWVFDLSNSKMFLTIPLVVIILMRYSYNIEGKSDGDPIEVLLGDKALIFLVFIYSIILFIIMYIGW